MPPVDRNILRLGLYELSYTDTPVGVVISEAVELAKRYSTARSGAFVNGVLARFTS
jgi:N utilization substance protein B